ncbi:hypothetical protein BDZ89DRAFT_1139949 [Hymenopellis radicata]|nr:hypothetical protein BDZ89DRAFT_1139949 [Hymenopellis radicata]
MSNAEEFLRQMHVMHVFFSPVGSVEPRLPQGRPPSADSLVQRQDLAHHGEFRVHPPYHAGSTSAVAVRNRGPMPISVAAPFRFRKAMHNACVVLRIRKKDVGIMHIAPATPRVAEKAKEDMPKNASSGGSSFRGAIPRKWSKSKAIVFAESYDAFAPSNELKRAKSFSGVFANAIVEDDLDLDDATCESMVTSYILHQSITTARWRLTGACR